MSPSIVPPLVLGAVVATTAFANEPPPSVLSPRSVLPELEALDGTVWIASHFAYRFRRFSTSGRQLFEMELPVDPSPQPPAEHIEGATALTAKAYTRTMICDRDGTLYSLVSPAATGTEYAGLDRYDSVTGRVDRILVDFPAKNRLTSAAGKDGIYIVGYYSKATSGIAWFIPWDDLRDQPWDEVTGIRSGTRLEN